ncbi:MAG: hypothetical protein R2849_21000 [Thermomicrobiales bacterium]
MKRSIRRIRPVRRSASPRTARRPAPETFLRILGGTGQQPAEVFLRQQPDVFGKETEEYLDQEVGGQGPARDAPLVQGQRQRPEPLGGFLGDLVDRRRGSQRRLARPERPEHPQVLRLVDRLQVELVDLLGGVGEVGVDLETVEVADDEQRRVLQILAVLSSCW